jgi:arylsulfatase A-like enzyme
VKQSILRGVVYGLAVWLVYGVVELVLSIGIQLLRDSETIVMGWQWRPIAMMFGVYLLIGLLAGAVAGLLLANFRPDEYGRSHSAAAVLTLILAFSANLAQVHPLSGFEMLALLAAAVTGAACLASLLFEPWRKALHAVTGPFTVTFILLIAPWLGRQALRTELSVAKRVAVSLVLMAAVATLGAVKGRLSRGRPASALRYAGTGLVVMGIFAAVVTIRSRPGTLRADQPTSLPDPRKPNVLLITMDTVRADHLSVYGYERDTTPSLRQFANAATVYTRAIATSDFTMPTHASIFTGLYPGYFGPIYLPPETDPAPLGPGHATLAEVLGSQGYSTVEIAANYAYLAQGTGLTRGFRFAELSHPVGISGRINRFYLGRRAEALLARWTDTADFEQQFRSAAGVSERGEELLRQATSNGRPFFLFLNYMDAHWPYISEHPFDARFRGGNRRFDPPYDLATKVNFNGRRLLKTEIRRLIAQYDGGIAAEDYAIGELIRNLRERGLFDNTLIVITADHGEEFVEHGVFTHNLGLAYEANLHVPLLIKYPGQREAARSDLLVSQVDLMPTILAGAGISPPAPLQGRSLFQRKATESDVVFSSAESPSWAHENPKLRGTRQAAFEGSMKLILWTNGPTEFYDLATDPGEEHNLYQADDPRVAALSQRLMTWAASMPQLAHNSRSLDKTTLEKLKSLGYVQ